MRRYPPSNVVYSFGPGGLTPAVKFIIFANIGVWLVTLMFPGPIVDLLGLAPQAVLEQGRVWQIATYLFVHSPTSVMHILFNMLAVWMFGVDLERRWGTQAFTRYYFITGIGAGLVTILVSFVPFDTTRQLYYTSTIGASGAVYGLLIAWGIIFPERTILFMLIVPMPARVFVFIMGALVFVQAVQPGRSAVANFAHLGGLVIGWIYLKGPRNLRAELSYHWARWRMERLRRKFNVHKGGRDRLH